AAEKVPCAATAAKLLISSIEIVRLKTLRFEWDRMPEVRPGRAMALSVYQKSDGIHLERSNFE
ncbi:MAG: hypothetical protein ACLT47_10525, partial [Sutterella wadsworthensis]